MIRKRHYFKKLLLTLLFILIFANTYLWSQATRITTLIINPNSLNDSEKFLIYKALLHFYPNPDSSGFNNLSLYSSVDADTKSKKIIKSSYNISRESRNTFDFIDTGYKKKYESEVLTSSNGEAIKYAYYPILPKIPKNNNMDFAQIIDYTTNTAYYSKPYTTINTDSIENFFLSNSTSKKISLTDNNYDGIWSFRMDSAQSKQFLDSIAKSNYNLSSKFLEFSSEPIYDSLYLENATDEKKVDTNYQYSLNINDSLLKNIRRINTDFYNYIYVIDYFNIPNQCSHGDKIVEIISEILSNFFKNDSTATLLKRKIISVPINYFDNKEFVNSLIDTILFNLRNGVSETDFLKNSSPDKRNEYIYYSATVKQYYKAKNPNNVYAIPQFVLNAILKYCTIAKNQADVISSSIYVRLINQSLGLKIPLKLCTLITAADNNKISIEDFYQNEDDLHTTEPLATYFTNNKKAGCFIIGGYTVKQEPYGMYSMKGDGITGAGYVNNWDVSNKYGCLRKDEIGNSFATPEIATYIWLAKAYWKSNNFTPLPIDIKQKFLLASSIRKNLAGVIGSCGLVNLNEFFYPSTRYLIDSNNNIVSNALLENSRITIDSIDSDIRFGKDNIEDYKKQRIIGICQAEGTVYVLFHASFKWEPIEENQIHIKLRFSNGETYDDLNSFFTKYHKIVNY